MTDSPKPLAVVIMAAGKGTRMKSDLPKVLHTLCGKPLLAHVVVTARKLAPDKIVAVVGHKRELVKEAFANADLSFAPQEPQLGTGHAVLCAEEELRGFEGDVAVLSGDVPLLTIETLQKLRARHAATGAAVTLLTATVDPPGAYGRIVRDEKGAVTAIVEFKDASDEEKRINEINAGVYLFDAGFLFTSLHSLGDDNAQGEYYLTDLVGIAVEQGRAVEGVMTSDNREMTGVNTVEELAALEVSLGK